MEGIDGLDINQLHRHRHYLPVPCARPRCHHVAAFRARLRGEFAQSQ